ncbi:hypothetical protein GCM10007320_06800 [Pseudorhodoferax aquiterrae]|uniref:histidine kinase n=2 Tax=Pseudorhodoferax aquiterrae TaxID=747304 RepID=A0ABQ3FVW2_9BURK|nr:hypothetical protein GCM10007320_06800 [Pseudorhodoferax aquiterrae]
MRTAPQGMGRRGRVAGRPRPRVWRMRSHLSALLVVTMLVTFAVAGAAILLARLPAIERATQAELQAHVEQLAGRLELLLGTAQNRLELLDTLARDAPAGQAERLLDEGLRAGLPLDAVYRLSADGRVLAAGLGGEWLRRRHELIGSDLSANALFQAVRRGPAVVWSGRHMSLRGGGRVAALAVRDAAGQVLVAEVSPAVLLQAVRVAAGRRAATLWVVDRNGDVIVDTGGGREQGPLNIRAWPLMQARLQGRAAEPIFRHEGRTYHAAVAHSAVLGWDFVGQAPTGWANPRVRQLVSYMVSSLAGCLLVGLLMAPFWAQRLTRPLQRIVRRAERTTRGEPVSGDWPRGHVAEFNRLAGDLQSMAEALQERERKFLAIFNASPVPMSVTDAANAYRLLDVNEAWCRELRSSRDQVLGRTATEIGLWTEAQRSALLGRMQGQRASAETVLLRGDGEPMQAQVSAQRVALASQDLVIWAIMDIGPQRRIEQQLREMNQQLGERVAQRTEALAAANAELSATVEQLRTAQDELVRAEKMAALGGLVAGVAHELNTPLGNGVMAVSAMAEAGRSLRAAQAGGLRRSVLLRTLEQVEQATDIAGRNLRRAAHLVHSFKQVAVDQTSAQRRSFELGDVVREMVASLTPSFARTPYRIDVQVPACGLLLDSYPGALGQALGNLVQNAVQHGFEGRAHGTVRITGGRSDGPGEDGRIWLRVADDGCGIAAAQQDRLFEPFMTARLGKGGIGLGLHISQAAVENLLGGSLKLCSAPGEGACFEMRLPPRAP